MTGCPFAATHADSGAEAASRCPFAALISKGKVTADTTPGQLTAEAAVGDAPEQQQQHPPGTCPLGFGSARGPSLSTLHCSLCTGLLFAACSTEPCHHIFCSSCISKFKDCPLCGRDIDGTTPDAKLQGVVDAFLISHSQSPDLVAAQTDLGPLPDHSPASFWLGQGLRSYAGGNLPAAIDRLERCRQLLLDAGKQLAGADATSSTNSKEEGAQQQAQGSSSSQVAVSPPAAAATAAAEAEAPGVNEDTAANQSAGSHSTAGAAAAGATAGEDRPAAGGGAPAPPGASTSTSAPGTAAAGASGSRPAVTVQPLTPTKLAARLGAVCGSLGDCWRRLNRLATAEGMYSESIQHLEPHAAADADVWHALTVSCSKLGDLRYMQQQLAAARDMYDKVLQLRLAALGSKAARSGQKAATAAEASTSSAAGPAGDGAAALRLDTAQSHLKLSDVCQAMGDAAAAASHLESGQQLLAEAGSAPAALGARQAQLQQVAEQLAQALTISA